MKHDPPTFDPEVRAILDEVIADPKSSLLRPPEIKCAKILGLTEEKVSVGANFLTSAERHLLERYREEVGRMLYQAAALKLRTPSPLESRLHSVAFGKSEALSDRFERLNGRGRVIGAERELEMLEQFSSRAPEQPITSVLASASLRILPCDEARILLAMTLNAEDRPDVARRGLKEVLDRSPSARLKSMCHANLGFFSATAKDFDGALTSYKIASVTGEPTAWECGNWLIFAIRDGNRAEIVAAAERLDDIGLRTDRLDEMLLFLRDDVQNENWWPTQESRRVMPRLIDRLPPRAKVFADVVA